MTKQERTLAMGENQDVQAVAVQLGFTPEELATYHDSLDAAAYAIANAAAIFDLLGKVVADAENAPRGLYPMIQVSAAHYSALTQKQAEDLFNLAGTFRRAERSISAATAGGGA